MKLSPDDLAHIEAIKQLKARYFRALDSKDWALWRDTFTREILFINARAGIKRRVSRENHAAYVEGHIGAGKSTHHGYTPEISLTGVGQASGIWAMDDVIIYPPREKPQGFRGWGWYHEAYRIEDGEWRIAEQELRRLRFEPLPGGLPPEFGTSAPDVELVWWTP
jgi:hypothetical protein